MSSSPSLVLSCKRRAVMSTVSKMQVGSCGGLSPQEWFHVYTYMDWFFSASLIHENYSVISYNQHFSGDTMHHLGELTTGDPTNNAVGKHLSNYRGHASTAMGINSQCTHSDITNHGTLILRNLIHHRTWFLGIGPTDAFSRVADVHFQQSHHHFDRETQLVMPRLQAPTPDSQCFWMMKCINVGATMVCTCML